MDRLYFHVDYFAINLSDAIVVVSDHNPNFNKILDLDILYFDDRVSNHSYSIPTHHRKGLGQDP